MNVLTRRHEVGDAIREAIYSPCERYRYTLTVTWDAAAPKLLYVMLNPSKATELANDPTIERCERRARALGYGAFGVANLFALRETSPERLRKAKKPEGPLNTDHLASAADWSTDILAAWGVHGAHRGQVDKVAQILKDAGKPLLCLGQTKAGHPRHPLYVSYAVKPAPWPFQIGSS